MHPNLFSIGSITIHTYGVFVATGVFFAVMLAMKIGETEGLAPSIISDICFSMIISGIIGARLLYIIMNMSYYVRYPFEILKIWKGGLVFSGALISACVIVVWHIRKYRLDFWTIGDIFAPCAAIGQAIGRIGCLMAGCCYGKPANYPWAIVFHDPYSLAPLNVPLHPTEAYHLIACIIIFLMLMFLRKYRSFQGQVFLWYLILHSTQRLFIERFRGDCNSVLFDNMTMTQFISLIVLLTAGMTLIIRKKRLEK